MCTAITYETRDFYFGRTFDYGFSYGEEIVVTPRHYRFHFQNSRVMDSHFAMIGIAHVEEDYPLYYDAVNEKGLGMAGLNFMGNAVYNEMEQGRVNIAVYELIPWILSQCVTVREAVELLQEINLVDVPFGEGLPTAQLHWMIAGHGDAATVEAVRDGLHIYENPMGVLTNNPCFPEQIFSLNNFMSLSPRQPKNNFCSKLPLKTYCVGMGAIGLPGDLSSMSRFVRASFVKMNSVSGDSEPESVNQFYHILRSVEQQKGCCILEDGKYETTIYTSCCNADRGIYYYTSYDNSQITAVDMNREDLEADAPVKYPLIGTEQIRQQN